MINRCLFGVFRFSIASWTKVKHSFTVAHNDCIVWCIYLRFNQLNLQTETNRNYFGWIKILAEKIRGFFWTFFNARTFCSILIACAMRTDHSWNWLHCWSVTSITFWVVVTTTISNTIEWIGFYTYIRHRRLFYYRCGSIFRTNLNQFQSYSNQW